MKIGVRTYLVNMRTFAKIVASRFSCLFALHNRIFRDERTHAHTHARTHARTHAHTLVTC